MHSVQFASIREFYELPAIEKARLELLKAEIREKGTDAIYFPVSIGNAQPKQYGLIYVGPLMEILRSNRFYAGSEPPDDEIVSMIFHRKAEEKRPSVLEYLRKMPRNIESYERAMLTMQRLFEAGPFTRDKR